MQYLGTNFQRAGGGRAHSSHSSHSSSCLDVRAPRRTVFVRYCPWPFTWASSPPFLGEPSSLPSLFSVAPFFSGATFFLLGRPRFLGGPSRSTRRSYSYFDMCAFVENIIIVSAATMASRRSIYRISIVTDWLDSAVACLTSLDWL